MSDNRKGLSVMSKRRPDPSPLKVTASAAPKWLSATIKGLRTEMRDWVADGQGNRKEIIRYAVEAKHRIANIPDTPFGRSVLQHLFRCHPEDYVLTDGFDCASLANVSPPLSEAVEPCGGARFYLRLKARLARNGQELQVANIPATKEGLSLFRQLVEKSALMKDERTGEQVHGLFYDTEYGVHLLKDVHLDSLAELNGLEDE